MLAGWQGFLVIIRANASAMGDETMVRKVFAFTLTLLILLSSVGCSIPFYYNGSHPELFVVATHSLLGVWGRNGEDTLILEEDVFGRVLFVYVGGTLTDDRGARDSILAILIAQRTTGEHSYFYSGVNFILREIEVPRRSRTTPASEVFFDEDFVMRHFTVEQLEKLKADNSWNEELNEDRFFRVPVSRHSKERYVTYIPEESQREAYLAVARGGQLSHPMDSVPLTMDKNGNVIFFMRGSHRDSTTHVWTHYPAFLFMFNADGNLIENTGAMELTDLWDYREQLREFKEINGWSFSYR